MTARWGIVVGVLAIAAGIAWFAVRRGGSADEASGNREPENSAGLTTGAPGESPGVAGTRRDGKIDLSPKARPERLGSAAEPAPPPSGAPFEAETRDPEWAKATETEIKRRFAVGVREGKLDTVECRREQCLLAMSGTEAEMTKALADLETEGGLRGFADHIILDGPVVADGKMTVRAYAVFDRRVREAN